MTTQQSANNPGRITGFVDRCASAGAQCTTNMPADCTCLVPADKTVTFDVLPGSPEQIQIKAAQFVDVLNRRFGPSGWSFILFPPGDAIGEVTISNDSLPDLGENDVRSYTNLFCAPGATLSEPTSISGSFKRLGRCGLVVDMLKILAKGQFETVSGVGQAHLLNHAMLHSMLKVVGLGFTGNSGQAATGLTINVLSDKLDIVPGQDCLVNNFNVTNSSEIVVSNSAGCPAFAAGM